MKKIILLALTTLMMVGCEEPKVTTVEMVGGTVTIDSCEYIRQHTYMYEIYIHKGNCRFCQERRKQEIKELVEQLKEK